MQTLRTAPFLGLTALLFGAAVPAQVSPRDRDVLEGSASTSYPLGRADCRLQTLHQDLGPAPRRLTGHGYRRDAINTRGALQGFRVEMSVTVSVSPRTPETASRTFVENVDNTTAVVVLPRTWVTFPATQRPGVAPASDFEFWIPWTNPFVYPGNDQTICVDVTVYGNDGPNGINANFTAYTDAHEQFKDGRALQPGFRSGNGCGAVGASTAAYANLEFRNLPTGMELDVQSRFGMPTVPSGEAYSALLFTYQLQGIAVPMRPSCMLYTDPSLVLALPGPNSDKGHWNGQIAGFRLPVGVNFYTQVLSVHPRNGFALSDLSELVVPPPGPTPQQVIRIANGSDATATTGSISSSVPVTEFF